MKHGSESKEIKNVKDPVQGMNSRRFRKTKKSMIFGKINMKLSRYDN